MDTFSESFNRVNSYYERPHCTKQKQCKHQFWRFNSYFGVGRYCCDLKDDDFRNCDEECCGKE